MQKVSHTRMLTPVKEVLKYSSLRRGVAKHVAIAQTIECAEDTLHALMPGLQAVRIQSLRDGVLTIVTESALVAHAMHLRAAKLISKVNERMGETAIQRVRYRIEKKIEEL